MSLRNRKPGKKEEGEATSPSYSGDKEKRNDSSKKPALLSFYWAFFLIFPFRLFSALSNPIGDCDETFNYWEPTHYLHFGRGFQTWEYSPEYGLRSYIYILLHVFYGKISQLLLIEEVFGKVGLFFAIRVVLGTISCFCEARFVSSASYKFGKTTATFTALFMAFSSGMFNATTAYLPQQFTMCALMLAFAHWFRGNHAGVIFWMGVSSLLGWPFSVLLGIPMVFDILYNSGFFKPLLWAILSAAACLIPSVLVDYFFYRKWLIAPVNIAIYNSSSTHGANLYGVEPWTYYVNNLFLNYNLVFFFSLLTFPLSALFAVVGEERAKRVARSTLLHGSSMMIWLALMFKMPHKEERFLFIIYPHMALCAAQFLSQTLHIFRSRSPSSSPSSPSSSSRWNLFQKTVVFLVVAVYTTLGVSRTYATMNNYNAPLSVYRSLYSEIESNPTTSDINVCVGKEWYRFPSRYFVPNQTGGGGRVEVQFLKSDFDGLLPKAFEPLPYGTFEIPSEMNDMNREEPSRYVSPSSCEYIIDLDLPSQREPHYGQEGFEVLYSSPFLDASRSPSLYRAFYIPKLSDEKNVFAEYQLLRQRREDK